MYISIHSLCSILCVYKNPDLRSFKKEYIVDVSVVRQVLVACVYLQYADL